MREKREISLTPGQVGELMPPIMEAVFELTPERVQHWVGKKSKLYTEIRKVLVGETTESERKHAPLVLEQVQFYKEVMGREIDPASIKLPVEHVGLGWILHMAEGLTPMQIWAVLEKRMPSWKYWGNLDLIISDRDSRKGAYTIRLPDRIEADEELANKSADDLKREGHTGITLPERALLEVFYNWKSGEHLDRRNVTICSGSRSPDGRVPHVCWCDGRLHVSWCAPSDSYGGWRARSVVS